MKQFTLEWNAVIALDEERDVAEYIRGLVALHGKKIDLGIVTTAASENTRERQMPETAQEFDARLESVGLSGLTRVLTVDVYDLTFWDYSIFAPDDWDAVNEQLWDIVKPSGLRRDHPEFALEKGISGDVPIGDAVFAKWRNKWCDVNSLHAHIIAKRDVFVTNDVKNFAGERKQELVDLGVGEIVDYAQALAYAQAL